VRDPDRLPEDLRNAERVFAVALDVTRPEEIAGAVRSVVDRFGSIDVEDRARRSP
jgi:NAD(P)-dependent dehydrogenase (short-subunit alcohol dehydrogenase family)